MIDWKEIDLRVNGERIAVESVEYQAGRIVTELAISFGAMMTRNAFADLRAEFITQERRRSRYIWAVKARKRRVLRRRLARVAHEERMTRKRALGAHDRYWRAR